MPDVRKNLENIVRIGLAAAYDATMNITDTFLVRNTGRMLLHFKKSGAGACIVTIQTPGNVDGLAIAERTVTIPATTGDKFIGPFPPNIYNDVNGDVKFTLSEVTGLTVAFMELQ